MNPYADPIFLAYYREQADLLEFAGTAEVTLIDAAEPFDRIPPAVLFVNVQDFSSLDAKLEGRVGLSRYERKRGWLFAKSMEKYVADYEATTGMPHPFRTL